VNFYEIKRIPRIRNFSGLLARAQLRDKKRKSSALSSAARSRFIFIHHQSAFSF
jgi:hypothetical protein